MRTDALTTSNDGFDGLLSETIMRSMRDLLGDSPTQAIAFHIKMDSPGRDPGTFHVRLQSLLGAPAEVVEEAVVKDLFKRLELLYAPKGQFAFEKYVNSAREYYRSRGGRAT